MVFGCSTYCVCTVQQMSNRLDYVIEFTSENEIKTAGNIKKGDHRETPPH